MHACIGEGNGNPLQCSCLENPRDGRAWWAAVYGVAQSRTRLKRLSSSSVIEVSLTGEKYTPNTGFKPILLYLPCQLGFLLKTFGYASIVIEFCSLLLREREGQYACVCVLSRV